MLINAAFLVGSCWSFLSALLTSFEGSTEIPGFPRYETPNPYGYNEAALVEKTRVLKELAQLYPDVNPLWREWVYDVCANTPLDQLEDMKQRIATNPGKHANPCGGVLQTA